MINKYSLLLLSILAIYLVQGSSSDLTEEEKQRLKPQPAHIEQCKEGFPYLGVGDFNLTDANFSTTIKSTKAVLVIVTAKWCDYCCKFEEIFADLKNDILSNKTLLHGLDIKLARATVENNPKLQDLVSKLPEFIFYYKEEPFVFEHSFEVSIVGSILSKIIRPYRVLNSPSELQEFMENDIIIQKGDHHFQALKIVGIYSKEDDLKDELKEFKSLTDQYCIYQDLQFALITKESVISPIYREKRLIWFPEYMRSTILLVDRRNKVHKIDPTLNSDLMGNQIHLKGKEPVEQLTTETQELFRRMKQPMLISFVDITKESLRSYLDMLTEVAKQFQEHINFAYMDNAQNANKRELLGIYHDKVPAIGINFPNDPHLYPYPEEQEITKTNLIKFIMDFLDRKLVPLDPKSQANRPSKNVSKHPIYKHLTNAFEVKFADFNELVLKEGTDVALLLFNPSDEQNLELFCKNYDKMAERFKALGIKSVRIAFYDLTNNPPPPSIQVFTSPMLVFLPAYQKQPPFKIYTDTPKTLPLMLYIEKYADVRFKLPDLPHLPPELHEAYYQQKKQMEEEKLNREKKDVSDDDVTVVEPKIDPAKRVIMDEL